jgi:hypothetical protein
MRAMDRVAIFVDAGYLFAEGARCLTGTRLARSQLYLDHQVVLAFLKERAGRISGLPILRIYWYDGATTGPNPAQVALAYKADVKLRLGMVSPTEGQLDVDNLIVTDLTNLARNHAMADAVVVSGDEDLKGAVQKAQEQGVRVHLLGIAPLKDNLSGRLMQEVDTVHEISPEELTTFLRAVEPSR